MRRVLFIVFIVVSTPLFSQYLSNLSATKADPLYTTYAAPITRSDYRLDQGYQLMWFDPESGIEMVTNDGTNTGIAFRIGKQLRFRLNELYREPVVNTSYSDLVRFVYFPYPELRVEVTFVVYSSQWSFADYRITNVSSRVFETGILPYTYFSTTDTVPDINHTNHPFTHTFDLTKERDGWMKEHEIPLTVNIRGYFTSSQQFDSASSFIINDWSTEDRFVKDPYRDLKRSMKMQKRGKTLKGMIGSRTIRLNAGESTRFRLITGLTDKQLKQPDESVMIDKITSLECDKLIQEDEQVYSRIPKLTFGNRDMEMLYWSSFSLMRQCMMPPEGACNVNYYVFSREPKWGWGYGGQVFHESLCMLAYAYMDPTGAMSSQRIFMNRQQKDGYINYRTGPYLDETIETNGKKTTSAPWLNYENLEIFNITGDRLFLRDAYGSGKKFYQYYISTRDSNNNGLCEWGAHAELESVRDARVAVWDKVGWASNFEGPDVNSMLVKEARSLEKMAKLLGNDAESKQWKEDADQRTKLINKTLWDEETGFYYNVNIKNQSFGFHTDNDLKIKEIIGFLPLWAGITDSVKTRILVNKMRDTSEFWRPFGIPSLSARNDYYCPIGYWNGPVWVQWNYLLFRGLLDQGYKKEAKELADKVLGNMIYHLKKDHVFWEFYSPDDHYAGWNKTYIWAGIAARFLLDL